MLDLVRREFEVAIPLATAWKHLAQVEQWPTWARHIKHVELNPKGELTLSTVGSFRLANGVKSDFKMTEIIRSKIGNGLASFYGLWVHYDHRFERME